jgi:hypothetical protein
MILNDGLVRTSMAAVMANFNVVFKHLAGRAKENHVNPVRITGFRAKIQIRVLPNKNTPRSLMIRKENR